MQNSDLRHASASPSGDADERYMRRCLQLASNGLGRVRPNPMVGCVVVRDGQIVAEDYHHLYGGFHAERNAILSCRRPDLLRDATLYVNLEPCSHHGLTPPCADLVVQSGVRRVVVCNDDPNPLVSGRGYARLEAAGIEVRRGVLHDEGRFLNRRFFCYMEQQRPYVVLKWAQTADGYMDVARQDGQRHDYWISNRLATRLSHRWRTEEAAIAVGSQTFLNDRPQLTPRLWTGEAPLRVVLDRRRRTQPKGEGWLVVDSATPQEALQVLVQHRVQSLLVEGGRAVLDAFIEAGLYDEVRIVTAPVRFGSGLPAPAVPPHDRRTDLELGDNRLSILYRFHSHDTSSD
ncbi:MAG: bifunctional diaminohydroxyphosphoribosylaminopyrimidine deaminase/5-amino-6-(5-phosphoribosylamino)uracil reductase RibD [Bacteroidales bacterium]|nr:bifunctional diaminohydroxyphosphoribosylaminopyrimidine deaminase/5-amino-6-(5-phosphoribosylamino)uracil reductase RibD [Bacteroidales bacterium]